MNDANDGITTFFQWLGSAVLAIILASTSACSSLTLPGFSPQKSPSLTATLPGQEIWKHGASSYLFGTNDTQEWTPSNIETQPAIQESLRSAGFTLIRSFFLDNASDAAVELRMKTIENSGAHCLGVITNISNASYDEHLVQYLGNRCLMYEFGNEPDYSNIPVNTYLQQWNKLVPLLRKINPSAQFVGPVTSNSMGFDGLGGNNNFMQEFLQGVKLSNVLPDAVSFHWYPCWQLSEGDCLAQAGSIGQRTSDVRQLVQSILGKDLPIGVTEWNYDPENPPPAYGDDSNFITNFTKQALSAMVNAGVAFACQFDAASYSGYGRLDMFNINTNQPKPQYFALKSLIAAYRSTS